MCTDCSAEDSKSYAFRTAVGDILEELMTARVQEQHFVNTLKFLYKQKSMGPEKYWPKPDCLLLFILLS